MYMYMYIYIYNIIYMCVWVTVKMVEDHFSIAGVFCQRCAQNIVKREGPPKSDNLEPYTAVH